MGGLSIWHWLVVLAVVLLLFGGSNKISGVMGDVARGIKSFKKNMGDDESMEAHETRAPAGSIAPPGVTQKTTADARDGVTINPRESVPHSS